MPYTKIKIGSRWFIKNKDTGKKTPQKGYTSESDADKYLTALEANVSDAKRDMISEPNIPAATLSTPCDVVPIRSTQGNKFTGYLALWGSPEVRDCLGTYFSKDQPPAMDLSFVPFPIRYDHGKNRQFGKGTIGKITRVWLDDKGIPCEGELDEANPNYRTFISQIAQGVLGISTGTPEYLAEFAEDGRFVTWPIGADVSLTDHPCEFRMPSVQSVRSLRSSHVELRIQTQSPVETSEDGSRSHAKSKKLQSNSLRHSSTTHGENKMAGKMKGIKQPSEEAALDPRKQLRADDGEDDGGEGMNEGSLTLGHMGLSDTSSVSDIYKAMCNFLGHNATLAILEDMIDEGEGGDSSDNGPEDYGDEESAPEDEERSGMYRDRADSPEQDGRGEDFIHSTEDETVSIRNSSLESQLRALLKQTARPVQPKKSSKRSTPTEYDELETLRKQNRALRRQLADADVVDQPRRFDRRETKRSQPQFTMKDILLDSSKAADLAHAVKILESVNKPVSDQLYRATAYKIAQEIEKKTETGQDMTVQYMTPFRSTSDVMSTDIRAFRSYRSNEVMGDTNTGFGSNYIGVFYDTSLWLKVRMMPIWRELEARGMEERVIPLGYSSDVIPLEGADFTWYRVPETVDIDATGRPKINITPSKVGTSSTTLTVRTMGALVYYSVLLEEDSIVPMAAELNRKAQIEVQEQIEYVIMNGDTSTGTGNINYKNSTLAASDVQNFTVTDGLIKAALVGNSGANARQGGTLSDLDYQLLFGLLGTANNGITGSDPSKLLFVVDPNTGLASDRLPIVKTKDINDAATIQNGHVKEMYAVPMFRSGQVFLADGTGYIDNVTAANNKFGRILLVRPDQWVIAFKRQITMEYFRDVPGQSNGMVITLRMGMQNRDAAQAAAMTYNLTIK